LDIRLQGQPELGSGTPGRVYPKVNAWTLPFNPELNSSLKLFWFLEEVVETLVLIR
jgi:hypothetical protein